MKQKKYFILACIILIIDQISKLVIRSFMELRQSIQVLGDFFRLTYIENPGAAFSLSFGSQRVNYIILSSVSLIAIIIISVLITKSKHRLSKISLSLILGGAAGNLIDRLIFGSVTDFLDFDFFDFIITRWPVFNVADSSIVVGAILFIYFTIFIEPKIQEEI